MRRPNLEQVEQLQCMEVDSFEITLLEQIRIQQEPMLLLFDGELSELRENELVDSLFSSLRDKAELILEHVLALRLLLIAVPSLVVLLTY